MFQELLRTHGKKPLVAASSILFNKQKRTIDSKRKEIIGKLTYDIKCGEQDNCIFLKMWWHYYVKEHRYVILVSTETSKLKRK